MGILKGIFEKTEYKSGDSFMTSLWKVMVEGTLDGLVIVGAIQLITHQLENLRSED